MNKVLYITSAMFFATIQMASAAIWVGTPQSGKKGSGDGTAANCAPPTGYSDMELNNVRMRVHTGGDMWWDLAGTPKYEIPKGSGKTALFAGSLWMGGQDVSGQLKVAALRFRQNGNDFWTGPLSTITSEIDPETCLEYDKHYPTTKAMIEEFNAWFESPESFPEYSIPDEILNWPAHGNTQAPYNQDYNLAPFFDRDGDLNYNPANGDYPRYDLSGNTDCGGRVVDLYGDENLWWVFNDKGNIHTETGAEAIGMEIRAQAFAYATADEVNNMTFYNYELVNRSTFTLTETYFGQWVDVDLGNAQDDFVGCDVQRGFGYGYNGDENDEDAGGALGYGSLPPAIGVDFFQGPFQDSDGKDNCLCSDYLSAVDDDGIVYDGSGVGYGDGVVDNERLGMRAFLYHNNVGSGPTADPQTGVHYYNYLRSLWRDNSEMVYGGTGHENSVSPPFIQADFMFPAESDPLGWGTGGVPQPTWTEVTAGNTPQDRRFIQSAGPFTLEPGAVNNITVGVVWARATQGNAWSSVDAVRKADDKTQALFDACFVLIDGPDAPNLDILEYDQYLVLNIDNPLSSNNYNESYSGLDPFIAIPDTFTVLLGEDGDGNPQYAQYYKNMPDEEGAAIYDSMATDYATYTFQGYQIYQLADNSVSPDELNDPDRARLIGQCDVEDDVEDLTNYVFNSELGGIEPIPLVEDANNAGIVKSFKITEDAFATDDKRLVNFKTYYYMAIAYAYNEYEPYSQTNPDQLDGQQTPYLAGRKGASGGIGVFSGIPHKQEVAHGGSILNSTWGDGVQITRISGIGNGGNSIDMSEASIDSAMSGFPWKAINPVYEAGNGPLNIKVVDPLNVRPGEYRVTFHDTTNSGTLDHATWTIVALDGSFEFDSESAIELKNEYVLSELGISITLGNAKDAGDLDAVNNGLISSEIVYDDFNKSWLGGVVDGEGNDFQNWIRSGNNCEADFQEYCDYNKVAGADATDGQNVLDDGEFFESMIGGTWAPYRMATYNTHGPIYKLSNSNIWTQGNMFYSTTQDAFGNDNGSGKMLNYLNSVNIYFTSDKSKWTRCPVIEAGEDATLNEDGVRKGLVRGGQSVDKDGNPAAPGSGVSTDPNDPNYLSETGMGWFPGYAIDIETGERLNIAFGEDSYMISENGRDMIWNPTSTMYQGLGDGNARFGGKHFIYVFRNNYVEEDQNYVGGQEFYMNSNENRMGSFDQGQWFMDKLSTGIADDYNAAWRACSWVGFPMLNENQELLSTDVVLKFRVSKEYQSYGAKGNIYNVGDNLPANRSYWVMQGPVLYNQEVYRFGDVITSPAGAEIRLLSDGDTYSDTKDNVMEVINGGLPMYEFSLDGLEAEKNVVEVSKEELDIINVVPNPYYAYSSYESDKLDNRVRIINLPDECTIRIYTLGGILVRELSKDDSSVTFVDWDLQNYARIPVASGTYLIHVNAPGVGEKVIRWMGVMRPVDLDSF